MKISEVTHAVTQQKPLASPASDPLADQDAVFIAHDFCGWGERQGRYTLVAKNSETLLCQTWMHQLDWDKAQLEFLERFPGLRVYSCPEAYNTSGTCMGTTEEICDRLRAAIQQRS